MAVARPVAKRPRRQRLRIVLPFVFATLVLVVLAMGCMEILSAARAYVGGESLWSKGQKNAVLNLLRYAETRATADWRAYEAAMAIPAGDRVAREELEKRNPDLDVARRGFLAGGNHPDDIERMIRLFRWFRNVPFIDEAITTWAEGDQALAELNAVAADLRRLVEAGADPAALAPLLARVRDVDARVTPLEIRFSATLSEATRQTKSLLNIALVVVALALIGIGAAFARRVALSGIRYESALADSEQRFRSLWETTNDAVLIIGMDSRVRFCNPAVRTLFGWEPDELIGQPLSSVQPASKHAGHIAGVRRYMETRIRHLDWNGIETTATRRDGAEFPVEIVFTEMTFDGEPSFVGFVRDITKRKQAENALRELNEQLEQRVAARTHELSDANERLRELDRLKSEFLATMSHELRTPLNSILGFAGLMREGLAGPVNAEQRRQLGFVLSSGRHLLALISDLLDLSRIESGRMEIERAPFDFADVVAEVVQTLRAMAYDKGLALEVRVSSVPMIGDRRKTYQVLLNLVSNAIKFTERGRVAVDVHAADGRLHVAVSDTGIGIRDEQMRFLFDAFRQLDGSNRRNHEGTGLGLHLSRKLLELMGGDVQVRSRYGAGSTFSISIPLVLPGGAVAGAATAADDLPARKA